MVTHTTRTTPSGTQWDDAHSAKIAFAADPDVSFWETAVGAPGIDGGDPIDMTTHHNSALTTRAPRVLKTVTPFQVVGRIASGTYDELEALINVNGWITVSFRDSTNYSFPGYLKSVAYGQSVSGNPQEATLEIIPTSQVSGVETDHGIQEQGTGT